MTTTAESGPGTGPGLTAKQAQGQRSRVEILAAAERLMSTKGYAATSISDLAKESGLPASSIYWHFTSKSGVLGAVMERGAQRYFRDIDGRHYPADVDPPTRLSLMLRHSADAIRAHPQFLRLFMILLLGSEGEHSQQEVVNRVRAQGKQYMGSGLRSSYAPWGPVVADAVAAQVTDYAIAAWDGFFIAIQASDAHSYHLLLEQMVTSIHLLAENVRDGG